jgi:anti-sigma28 factor (negative regulator of flagellin synthesis)
MKLRDTFIAKLLVLIAIVPFLASAYAQSETKVLSKLAQKIVDLRSDVESLNTENNARKEEMRGELKSITTRKAALAAQIQTQELSLKQSNERLKTIKEELAKSSGNSDSLKPLILGEIKKMKKWVATSLPFQKEKRMKVINDIDKNLSAGTINAQKAMGSLWAFVEDELRLGRENGVHRQTLIIDGEEHLVSVAKLGMIAMFYQTTDNKYGHAKRDSSGGFEFVSITDKNQVELVVKLIEGLKKQIRSGAYTIPNVL